MSVAEVSSSPFAVRTTTTVAPQGPGPAAIPLNPPTSSPDIDHVV
jgi:hypothetical protein